MPCFEVEIHKFPSSSNSASVGFCPKIDGIAIESSLNSEFELSSK